MPTIITIAERVRALLRRLKKDPRLRILGTDKIVDDLGFRDSVGLTAPMNREFGRDLGPSRLLLPSEVGKCVFVDDLTALVWKKLP